MLQPVFCQGFTWEFFSSRVNKTGPVQNGKKQQAFADNNDREYVRIVCQRVYKDTAGYIDKTEVKVKFGRDYWSQKQTSDDGKDHVFLPYQEKDTCHERK